MKTVYQPLISVIIPTFNRSDCVERAIKSVLMQTHKNLELLIVDNSTNEKTRQTLTTYLKDSRIRYFYKNEFNSSESLNYGIKCALGNYIALLDDDDEFMECKLETQLSQMLSHEVDFSLTNCIKVYDGRKTSPKLYFESFILDKNNFSTAKLHLSHTHIMFDAAIKEECFFDHLLVASDDFDLIHRILCNHNILFIKEPLSYIHKSLKRRRISTNPQLRINTFQNLIKKVDEYCWAVDKKQKAKQNYKVQLGFWQIMNREYKSGRNNLRVLSFLPFKRGVKYKIIYVLSFIPPVFRLTKLTAEKVWILLPGRIKA